jgi:hypothetical protein
MDTVLLIVSVGVKYPAMPSKVDCVEDCRLYPSPEGRGFSLETSISVPGAEPIITENSLNWAAGSNFQEQQWIGAGYSIEELTNNPSDPIGFPSVGGNTGPLFVGHEPSRPSLLNRASATIQSNQAQTVDFKLRSSRNYNNVIRSFSQDIPKGQSTTTYRVLALGIEPMALEINPQDGTQAVLTDYSVFP